MSKRVKYLQLKMVQLELHQLKSSLLMKLQLKQAQMKPQLKNRFRKHLVAFVLNVEQNYLQKQVALYFA